MVVGPSVHRWCWGSDADRLSAYGGSVQIETGRVRDDAAPAGVRVLVDRLWPRGVSKQQAAIDHWAKTLAPSTELRRWYHADRDHRFDEFVDRYRVELDSADAEEPARLAEIAGGRTLVLLSDVRDLDHSHVPVLCQWLREREGESAEDGPSER